MTFGLAVCVLVIGKTTDSHPKSARRSCPLMLYSRLLRRVYVFQIFHYVHILHSSSRKRCENLIDSAEESDYLRTFVNVASNLRVPKGMEAVS